jgi:uncharacterized protein
MKKLIVAIYRGFRMICLTVKRMAQMCNPAIARVRLLFGCIGATLLIGVSMAWAQSSSDAQAPKVPDHAQLLMRMETNKGILYKATRDNKTIHLFGTLHVGKETFLPLGKTAVSAALTSERIFLELDLLDPDLLKKYNQIALAQVPFSFTPKQAAAIAKIAPTTGQTAQALMQMKPFHIISLLSLSAAKAAGLSVEYGSESFFVGLAQSRKIPIGGLETLDEQLGFANHLSQDQESQMIDETLSGIESGEAAQLVLDLATSWQKGDIAGLGFTYQKSVQKGDLLSKLFDQEMRNRNRTMVIRMVDHANKSTRPIFVAVGALHFWGTNNIVDLLQARGFKVEKLH